MDKKIKNNNAILIIGIIVLIIFLKGGLNDLFGVSDKGVDLKVYGWRNGTKIDLSPTLLESGGGSGGGTTIEKESTFEIIIDKFFEEKAEQPILSWIIVGVIITFAIILNRKQKNG